MYIEPYGESAAPAWDQFCEAAHNATFLHTRHFLSYHGDRFDDRSLLLRDDKDELVGLFPAATSPADPGLVVSHPGLTYGGLVHQASLYGERFLSALSVICAHYAEAGYDRLLYKVIPRFYHRVPAEDDLYALFRLNARLVRRDLSATVDLSWPGKVSQRRVRGRKKAQKSGVVIEDDRRHLPAYWALLAAVLADRHDARPVHSLEEMQVLTERFPRAIQLMTAFDGDQLVAGVVLFTTPTVMHAQYIAAAPAGYAVNALDLLFEHAINAAQESGLRYFDFGISNEQAGRVLNQGLYQFKHEFGAGGCVHDFYEIPLKEGGCR